MELKYAWYFDLKPQMQAGRNPIKVIRNYGDRGMSWWTDVKDWLGGYPMEFAGLAETQDFVATTHGLNLVNLKTGEGCTEYIFANPALNAQWGQIDALRARVRMEGPFTPIGGHGYSYDVPHLEHLADTAEEHRSRLVVYEDDKVIGFRHSPHELVRHHTFGRVSHWAKTVCFSASDGSDPNVNGRSYSYCIDF